MSDPHGLTFAVALDPQDDEPDENESEHDRKAAPW
jgi:hypothetical protein